jgi:hypothetical protein
VRLFHSGTGFSLNWVSEQRAGEFLFRDETPQLLLRKILISSNDLF